MSKKAALEYEVPLMYIGRERRRFCIIHCFYIPLPEVPSNSTSYLKLVLYITLSLHSHYQMLLLTVNLYLVQVSI